MKKYTLVALAAAGLAVQAQVPSEAVTGARVIAMPVVPYASAASSEASIEGRWEIKASDVTLARTFERWAVAAGHRLKWDAGRNFLVGASDTYSGTFEGALQHVLSSPGIRFSDYPLEACIYANNPPLVRVTRQGEQSRECAMAANP